MKSLYFFTVILVFSACTGIKTEVPGKVDGHGLNVVEGIHVETGLKDDPGLPLIIANCTACHSAKMIIQNRATRDGWKNLITWMQNTQKLWDLGENEEIILNYLEKNYSPEFTQIRRKNLENIEWYDLD